MEKIDEIIKEICACLMGAEIPIIKVSPEVTMYFQFDEDHAVQLAGEIIARIKPLLDEKN